MTPELLLNALLQDIYIHLTLMEGEISTNILIGDFRAYETGITRLKEVAHSLGADVGKYNLKEGGNEFELK